MNKTIPALALAIGFAGGYAVPRTATEPAPVAVESPLLDALTPECRARLLAHSDAPECVTGYVNAGTPREAKGWICNGAFMGKATQACLDAASE